MRDKSGRPIDDARLNEWADAFERGEWPEGKTTQVGRPALSDGETKILSFRIPASKAEAFAQKAKREGKTKSEAFRDLVDRYLEA